MISINGRLVAVRKAGSHNEENNMDRMIGGDFETGLTNLKVLAEQPAP
jgi:hypothetical protein